MDFVFSRMNHTLSVPGEQMLYALLRTLVFSRKPLEERSEIVGHFIKDKEKREQIQIALSKLGKIGGRFVVEMLWVELPARNKFAFLYPWLLLLVPVFVISGLLGLAKKFRSFFFKTMTLIGRKDNIIEGKSYYLDEILTLLRIIQTSRQDVPCLCLIDELFRGTNSVERISASAEVLLYYAKARQKPGTPSSSCVMSAIRRRSRMPDL